MRDESVQIQGASLCDLPQVLMNKIVEAALHTMQPKEAARLATTSTSLRAAVASDREYWRLYSRKHNFLIRERQAESLLQASEGDWWFIWYMQRMHTRWLVRCTVSRFINFMDPQSVATFNVGANLAVLDAFQLKTCFSLPWQVWELYRYRNGQAEDYPGAIFISSSRLLALDEVLEALLLEYKVEGSRLRNSKGNDVMVPITTEFEGRKRFYAGESGSIYLGTAFQKVKVADSLVAWLQKWLT